MQSWHAGIGVQSWIILSRRVNINKLKTYDVTIRTHTVKNKVNKLHVIMSVQFAAAIFHEIYHKVYAVVSILGIHACMVLGHFHTFLLLVSTSMA